MELLNKSPLAKQFIGGTAVSCVLLPNNYHRFHAPVSGTLIESMMVPGLYFGISDGETWFGRGNTGASDMKFSTFQDFKRSYYIYNTSKYGLVAQVAVGLAEINSIQPAKLRDRSTFIGRKGEASYQGPLEVSKGDQVGYFQYGGSLNMLLFETSVFSAIQVLMGNRLGKMEALK